MDFVGILRSLGVPVRGEHAEATATILGEFVMILLIAFLVTWVLRRWLSLLIWKIMQKKPNKWHEAFYQQRFFSKLSYLVAPVACYVLLSKLTRWEYADIVRRFLDIWLVLVCMVILFSLLEIINRIYDSYPVAKNRPITVFIQVFKVFIYTVVSILIISILVNKSPEHLLVGVGAFAAVVLLVFRDSILGFVAGVQLIANKMVRIGDWIVMPNNHANGTVLEINLYTVKVRNWDMTISTIPTYQMVSQSFINWRGMQESAGRRIERYVNIDIGTVHFLSEEEIEVFRNSLFLRDYIGQMEETLGNYNKDKNNFIDERKLTNLGVFRQYMELWLNANPNINKDMTHMVRQLQPTATGIPIEIYCFSAKQEWVSYEKIQSDIFDHVLAIIPHFNLKVFQYPNDCLPLQKN
ncbi:mechanosensitive ion channel family protein [Odoribacter lunatus]|uniref:mechanosensitive ion channel family protein n=1 Tax=Odoribacter lunatus TaxID=2941335 RepID=UPI00203BB2D7|nr:mechanosensitive ion channel domain-containing protein [Odoribacter lunatus]